MHTSHHYSARPRAQIVLSKVSIARGENQVLTDVDLTLNTETRLGIVGENGRGKTTLLHLISGQLEPDAGTVFRIGSIGIAEQEMSIENNRTVHEVLTAALEAPTQALADLADATLALATDFGTANGSQAAGVASDANAAGRYADALELAEALDAWDASRRLHIALEAFGVVTDPETRLNQLSVGQRYRIRLACLLGMQDDFLLLDEPTNHLDRDGLDYLTNALRERRGGVAFVSHDRALLMDVAESIIDLDETWDGKPRLYGAGYDQYREGHRAERAHWEQLYRQQESERTRLEQDLADARSRLISGWRPPKGTGKHTRATRAAGLVQSMHRREATLEAQAVTIPEPPLAFKFPNLPARPGASLLTAEAISSSGRLAGPVTLELRGATKMLVTGPNGAGKSTLLALLAGELEPSEGRIHRIPGQRIVLLRQESVLPLGQRAGEAYQQAVERMLARGEMQTEQALPLGELGLLSKSEAAKRIAELSMGQRRRLDLALVLVAHPEVLLLDEPTNHLSVTLVDELIEALRVTPAAVVMTSHDRQLLRDLAAWQVLRLT